ncbi:hypothetical protein ACFFX0_16615 [Citricoccus parietis]|uniref:Uncharacterized protein n=1 Tax=Citricoccus parietis TaxID=592307 RepID=A0ABV5G1B5_9MICC
MESGQVESPEAVNGAYDRGPLDRIGEHRIVSASDADPWFTPRSRPPPGHPGVSAIAVARPPPAVGRRLGAAAQSLECLVAGTLNLVLVLAFGRLLGQIGGPVDRLAAQLFGLGALKRASDLRVACRCHHDLAERTQTCHQCPASSLLSCHPARRQHMYLQVSGCRP